jgi:demethylmenaquinone methyltransferase / 2-methoxy-6-polyprenyl-1,4-benzoquinol methylase
LHKYDAANSVLSMGIHSLWKRKLVAGIEARPGARILDLATGTGDIAFLFEKQLKGRASITALDFSPQMLRQAQLRAVALNSRIRWVEGDLVQLPFEDGHFDCVTISFGLRNCSNPTKGLSEMGRVLRSGGKLAILEFGRLPKTVWGKVFRAYQKKILPKLGGWISGNEDAYRYLERTSDLFPSGADFKTLVLGSGAWNILSFQSLSGGIATLSFWERTSGR